VLGLAVRDLLAVRLEFTTTAREELGNWWQPEMVEQMLADPRKAEPDVPGASDARTCQSKQIATG